MANIIRMKIEGKNQGLISAGCGTFDSIGNKYQAAHTNEILVYSAAHSITREQSASHHPFTIVKPIDKSSPLLGVSISENEELYVELGFYQTDHSGGLEKYYSIQLRKAFLSCININYPHSLTHEDSQPEEIISLNYRDIVWTHHKAGTSGYSICSDRVY
ncbi:Hcp family type VI secretion system effector [Serratia silvae]|uniref:Hcp family type VI secretion system effector n=1 Tax=Serratia silvae TaxID=2824122 RepID=A0ABT0K6N7_9GAMM|nr:Hcp family type VI secretion system effector [Serratia silvae]MCL1027680.1 Hcp family type VI secretion system effector [Serratia silvae]